MFLQPPVEFVSFVHLSIRAIRDPEMSDHEEHSIVIRRVTWGMHGLQVARLFDLLQFFAHCGPDFGLYPLYRTGGVYDDPPIRFLLH